jgi:hypothetical protein
MTEIRWYDQFGSKEDGYLYFVELAVNKEGKIVGRGTRFLTDYSVNMRLSVLRLLSGEHPRCVRCGLDDIRALQIDHVFGGGKDKETRYSKILEEVKEDLASPCAIMRYQVLCANCNKIKVEEKNELHVREALYTEDEI